MFSCCGKYIFFHCINIKQNIPVDLWLKKVRYCRLGLNNAWERPTAECFDITSIFAETFVMRYQRSVAGLLVDPVGSSDLWWHYSFLNRDILYVYVFNIPGRYHQRMGSQRFIFYLIFFYLGNLSWSIRIFLKSLYYYEAGRLISTSIQIGVLIWCL